MTYVRRRESVLTNYPGARREKLDAYIVKHDILYLKYTSVLANGNGKCTLRVEQTAAIMAQKFG